MEVILARHTGKDEETVRHDIERDKFLTAEDAKEYGIIDEVLTMIKRGTEPAVEVMSSLPGRNQIFPPGLPKGFDGVHRTHEAVPSKCKHITASRDMPAGDGRRVSPAVAAAPCKGVSGWHASVTVGTC